jgi:ADP-ribosylation factor-binding protein GGA
LEICDYVNSKQGSAPREAAIAVVKLISQRDPQISELAIALLDNLVKNCDYPFHLQISRKEFLNELVKRFPERPPMRYTRIQRLVLAQIEEWYQTICRTSKYKDDFNYIKDMHRLLTNKGYIFPEVKVEDAAVLNPSDNLKSMEDLRKEEAIVHSAKLQEFIRRGKPADLQEANKLMKIMAGFKDDNVKQNKKQLGDDIAKLKRKVEILADMLNAIQSNASTINDNDEALVELYSSVKSSQPIITRIIEEDNENEDQVNDLLALNDNVNNVINKFQLLKGGKIDEAKNIKVVGGSGASANSAIVNLIDFDDDDTSAPISSNSKDQQGYDDLLSDLANLSFNPNSNSSSTNQASMVNPLDLYGFGGSISLNSNSSGVNIQQQQQQQQQQQLRQPIPNSSSSMNSSSNFDFLSDLNSPSPQLQSNIKHAPKPQSQLDPFGFDFPSSTPVQVQTSNNLSKVLPITENFDLKIEIGVGNSSSNQLFYGKVLISNLQSKPIDNFKFLIAVPRTCKLNLQPQSNDTINAFSKNGITQDLSIENSQNKPLKIKWKFEYNKGGEQKEDTGVSVLEI